MDRVAEIFRETKETKINLKINLDNHVCSDESRISTGIGFFDHMLNSFSVHSGVGLSVECEGDLQVDQHHSVEDVGIVLGRAVSAALENKSGIARYGNAIIPMDEALGKCFIDICGRAFLVFTASFSNEKTGGFENSLVEEFFRAFAFNAGVTLHVSCEYGNNDHHKIEAVFKAFAYAFKQAIKINPTGEAISAKGCV